MISDDLTTLFEDPSQAAAPVRFRQGTVLAFNNSTGQNQINVAGAVLVDIPMLNSGEAVALKPGHVVGLLLAGQSWFILGRITPPNDPNFASASVDFSSAGGQAFNFALSTGLVTKVSSNELVVPAWADEAIVHITGSCTCLNTRAVLDSFGFNVGCLGGDGGTTYADVAAGGINNIAASSRNLFTGLSGGEVLTITGQATSFGAAWAANASNTMFIHAIAIYKSNV